MGLASNYKNVNKVPRKQWAKWSSLAREVFNEVYFVMMNNQTLLLHPELTEVPNRQWSVLAWNTSWVAADAVEHSLVNENENYLQKVR